MSASSVAARLRELGVPIKSVGADSILITECVEVLVEPRRFCVVLMVPGEDEDSFFYSSERTRIADLLPDLGRALGMRKDAAFGVGS